MKKGTAFIRPYSEELLGSDRTVHYAYPREILKREDIFPYFVLDGGAYNLLMERFGTAGGEDILRLTESGELFEQFRRGGKYSWERSFAYTEGTGFRKKYEWQIWPQRLYMTIPLAHKFLCTQEERYARLWLDTVQGWDKAHPYQPFDSEIHYLQTDMVWRDMQVAWRAMALLHGIFMLQEAPFTKEEWKYIYSFIELHVNHLHEEAQDRIKKQVAQNHVLQIGVALIMAAVMLPELKCADEVLKIGIDTVEMNRRGAIFADGGSDEDSPSYSHFIVRLYLEALLLLENNGKAAPQGLRESIVSQYEWLYQMSTPDGRTLQLSDSYSMDSLADIRRAQELICLPFPREKRNVCFKDSGVCTLRRGDITLYADAMNLTGGHRHFGRPQILLYYKNTPVLVDGGVPSYDRWELYLPLRGVNMHNTVYCPDMIDELDSEPRVKCKISNYDGENCTVFLESEVEDCAEIRYKWYRTVKVGEDEVIITDRAESEDDIPWRANFFMPRADTHRPSEHAVSQLYEDLLITLTADSKIKTDLRTVMNEKNAPDYAVLAYTEGKGKVFCQRVTINFKRRQGLSH